MNSTRNCQWCGKTGYEQSGYKAPQGWVSKTSFTSVKWFCGNKCLSEYEKSNQSENNSMSDSRKPKATLEEKLAEQKMEQIKREQQKEQHENYATKIFEVVNLIKPYFKYIIPVYLIAFAITMFIVKKKNYTMTAIGFAIPLIIIAWAFFNKPKNS